MMIRSGGEKDGARRPRKNDDLLSIWLDLVKQIDNPPKRRAARLRRSQRQRRAIPIQRLRLEGYSNPRDAGISHGTSQRRLAP